MNKLNNKNHWYDGWFYEKFIAPNQDKLFKQIKNLIEPNSKVIDVGCGTGRFSFYAADKCKSILGIDLSEKNIKRANIMLKKKSISNISFQHKSVSKIISNDKEHFDYAVMTYVIHEVNEQDRITLINEIKQISDKIIVGEYLVPRKKSFACFVNELVEYFAGREHYKNFKSYVKNGGIHALVKETKLKIITEINNQPKTSQLVVLGKS
ncbi:MAG: class I SAM-dependent methyltransferase [Ignavibacteriales bacterium]|nr:class I SAM-dependent methyltransferase [Ignavibacteriales bacterium]